MNKTNKMISISFDIAEKLRLEKNASELIENLLQDYYSPSPNTIKAKIIAVEAQKETLATELKQATEKQAEEAKKAAEKLKFENKAKNYAVDEAKAKALQREAFDCYDVPKETRDTYFEDFYSKLIKGEVKNLILWANLYGFKKKEKRT